MAADVSGDAQAENVHQGTARLGARLAVATAQEQGICPTRNLAPSGPLPPLVSCPAPPEKRARKTCWPCTRFILGTVFSITSAKIQS